LGLLPTENKADVSYKTNPFLDKTNPFLPNGSDRAARDALGRPVAIPSRARIVLKQDLRNEPISGLFPTENKADVFEKTNRFPVGSFERV
jgi:hypothetical protein